MLKRLIRLNMNEIPYSPPERIIEAAKKGLLNLNRYAEPEDMEQLRGLLADYSGVSSQHVILGPGSDLLLREMIHNFSKERKVIMVSPSFFPTVQTAKQFATKLVRIRLSPPEFDLNIESLAEELKGPSLVIIDNPNNPTGKVLLEHKSMETLLANTDALFMIDEAYYEFSRVTFADMIRDHSNLAISRTMDKSFGLAGARIGYIIAGETLLRAFSPFHVFLPQATVYAATEALNNPDYMKENVQRVIVERERVKKTLNKSGIKAYLSRTNFLLVKTDIPDIARKLSDANVLISDLSDQLPAGFIRVSIGIREENDVFINKLTNIVES